MSEKKIAIRIIHAASDLPFVIGSLLVALLLLAAVIGPELAPRDPHFQDRIQFIEGELRRAPIEPGEVYPLGTDPFGVDMLTLLLYGVRATITITAVSTLFRILLGLVFGAVAGWWPESWFDRAVRALIHFFAAIPNIILAIMIVYAVGIRSGQISFIIALAVVGWGEVAQIFRSHVFAIRREEYILGARAVGLEPVHILSRHVLPNLTGVMVTLAALEMSNALLLLGELGFVSVFIGSGGIIAGDVGIPAQIVAEIPEWGALLGSTWRYFRSYPWLPGAPALLFAISILGFNLFGFGLQRFIARGRFYPSGISVLRLAGTVAAILLGVQFILSSMSPENAYEDVAVDFDALRAWKDITILTRPELEGRYPDSEGRNIAAGYIANVFAEGGLNPLPSGNYFQTFTTLHGTITADSVAEFISPAGERFFFDTQIAYDPTLPFNLPAASITGPVTLFGSPPSNLSSGQPHGIFLVVEGEEFSILLRVTADQEIRDIRHAPAFAGPGSFLESSPSINISYSAAAQILAEIGVDLDEIVRRVCNDGEIMRLSTGFQASVQYGMQYANSSSVNVVGYLPGSDIRVQTQRILVAAVYSGKDPLDGQIYHGADEQVSAVATLLEIVRLWHEQEYEPERTVVFAALDENGGEYFTRDPIIGSGGEGSWTVVLIEGVGAGNERLARFGLNSGLERMFDRSAGRLAVKTEPLSDFHFFFSNAGYERYRVLPEGSYTGIVVTRTGDEISGTAQDTRTHIVLDDLAAAGEVITHFLMRLSSQ